MFAREVSRALEERGVPYVVVGGVAVNLHGIPRATYDVDIVVPLHETPLRACRKALESLGLCCRLPLVLETVALMSPEEMRARNLIAVTFTDPQNPLREVDVLVAPPVPAEELIQRSKVMESAELALPVACVEDLVALKTAAGRAQDRADLKHLKRLLPKPKP